MIELLTSNFPPLNFSKKSFQNVFFEYVSECDTLDAATGYISADSILELKNFIEINKKPNLNLIIGMHLFEGFSRTQLNSVQDLNDLLINKKAGSVKLACVSKYHGKIYSFRKKGKILCSIIGSSNLSSLTSSQRIYETDILITDKKTNVNISNFLENLSSKYCCEFKSKVEKIPINEDILNFEGIEGVDKITHTKLSEIVSSLSEIKFSIPINPDDHPKSNLNSFFGKGRENQATKIIQPRHWYEAEIIVPKVITTRPSYPQGNFYVITDDGWKFQCKTSGDYFKNFRSKDDLRILGRWLKGRLESAGALRIGDLITENTLSKYGKNTIDLIKISNSDDWYINFGSN